jgi:ABC-2 type transport system ATP-binding protein
LLGPNGAGKTTLLRIITQIIDADSGEIRVHGDPLKAKHIQDIGYLPEERGLYKKMKVGEQLLYLAMLKGISRAHAKEEAVKWLRKFEITDWWDKKVEDLSKGMSQKIQFISTVIHKPSILILDEPFSGFDPINTNLIKDEILKLRDEGSTIIFSTHRMESVEELCDDIALINKSKKILDGTKEEIKASHRANLYRIMHTMPLEALDNGFELIESLQQDNGLIFSKIRINNEAGPNDLLKYLIDKTEIHSFDEQVPSINDIFISNVKKGTYE